ncbi:MAG TPA: hypothetical protein VIJ11_06050, partial [Galbitalea sp.]
MLFDVAALLITSAALGPAAEASIAPESVSISAPLDPGNSVPPVTNNGPGILVDPASFTHGIPVTTFEIPRSSPAEVRTLSGISLVRELAALSSGQISKLVTSDPALVTKLLASPPDASDAASLWSSLSPATRTKLAAAAPRLVGGLDGFP